MAENRSTTASVFQTPTLPVDTCRLIVDPPRRGALNMAIDELLLEQAIDHGTATLRFYQWSEPTLSLGYFQAYEDRHAHTASRDCAVVRRTTGGGAILHDRELTYSLATPVANASRLDHSDLVNLFHQTISQILEELGVHARPLCCDEVSEVDKRNTPFLCFQRRERGDVVALAGVNTIAANRPTSAKLVGSAQRRRHGALLQHGSVLLEKSSFAPELAGCVEFGATEQPDIPSLITAWSERLAEELRISLQACALTSHDLESAETLAASKFASSAWLARR